MPIYQWDFIDRFSVPRWRTNKAGNFRRTRNSLLAGQIENLSDQEYLDRHSKYELEERKIEEALQRSIFVSTKQRKSSYDAQNFISPFSHSKKWQDVVPRTLEGDQRIGECRLSLSRADRVFPVAASTICVKDHLPVTAFGAALPIIKSRCVQLFLSSGFIGAGSNR